MDSKYDFIVVGAGPSGCSVASRLAQTASKPKVLLVEAGGDNKDPSYLIPAERFTLFMREPSLNWGYQTEPQTHLKNQTLDYSRGKGLGGSTSINFCCYVVGADEDYNEWAQLVDDQAWEWRNVKERLKRIESYHVEVAEEMKDIVNPKPADHGTCGPLHLSYADPMEKGLTDVFMAAKEIGLAVNPDMNSGDPIGFGIGPACMSKGFRTTAACYLLEAGDNLTVLTNSTVAQVLFTGKQATGIRTADGREFYAKRDVILSGGAINSPQLLMLSGVGPADELKKHGIPVVHELIDVGKHLQDHVFSGVTLIQKPGTNDRMTYETNPETQLAARAQHTKDKTGILNSLYCSVSMGWLKNDAILSSKEFGALDNHTKKRLLQPSVPTVELLTHAPPLILGGYELQPTDCYLTGLAFAMNPQSYGEVTLNSANPVDAPKIQPNLASHPFDRRALIESLRQLMDLLEAPIFKESTIKMVGCPKSRSDDDIWDHVSSNLFSSWHMCQTVRMGKKGVDGACTDKDFRVRGVQNLRVVDMSVAPLIPNNHTQSTAYLIGETAAEKIIAEYEL